MQIAPAKRSRTTKSRTSAAAPVYTVPSSDEDDDSDAYEPGVEDGVDPDDSDVVPDGGAFEHISDFEGDDDDLLDEEEMKAGSRRGKKTAAKKTSSTALAKRATALYDDDLDDAESEDEAMLHQALLASLRDQQAQAGPSANALDDDAAIARVRAERAALAAEKRLELQQSLAKLSPQERAKAEAAIAAALAKQVRKHTMQQGKGMVMSREQLQEKRRQERQVAQKLRDKLKKLEREEVKRLGRRLTQGEKNGLMLTIHHPELKNVWGDLEANIKVVKPVPMEAHPSLKLTLLPFQKESLYWMKKQEEGPWHGGMLADEMGMGEHRLLDQNMTNLADDVAFLGKTIQTIALLLSEPRRKPSLVVAPVVALMQWKHEIETHAEGFTVSLHRPP